MKTSRAENHGLLLGVNGAYSEPDARNMRINLENNTGRFLGCLALLLCAGSLSTYILRDK
ncbi:MAG TPA: hypothetical protein VLX12_11295 [Syntrophorhabdales bacterium]|nr:hypothetical protein [Syntrophorhabdales bacterium]